MRQRVTAFSRLLGKLAAISAILTLATIASAQGPRLAAPPGSGRRQPCRRRQECHQSRARKRPGSRAERSLGRCADEIRRSAARISGTPGSAGPVRRRPAALQPGAALRRPQLPRFASHAERRSKRSTNTTTSWARSTPTTTPIRRGRTSRRRGATAMDIALANENFLRNHGIRVRGQQVEQLRTEISQLPNRYAIRSSRDASAVAAQIARLARQRIGLSETATLLEFTSAAAGGLDHYSAFLTARSAPRYLFADRRQLCRPGR